jgi:iron(II)-dependent oxidoreductase
MPPSIRPVPSAPATPQSTPAVTPAATAAGTPVTDPQRDPGTGRLDAHGVAQVWVPAGTFTMGADRQDATRPTWAANEALSEGPAHEVRLSRGYWIDTTEVTVAAFAAFTAAGGYDDQSLWSADGWAWRQAQGSKALPQACLEQAPDEPQVCVTWYEAEAYAHWRGGRLPTEAEWEFAARGPQSLVYPWGNTYDPTLANLDGGTGPMKVGSYPKGASWVGALDMAGNAMEWVADWLSTTYYGQRVADDPTGPATGSIKVEKGGWWGPAGNSGAYVGRAAYRHFEDPPFYADHHIGFRIVSQD